MPLKIPFTKDMTYTVAEIDNMLRGAIGGALNSSHATVDVAAGGWTADTASPPVLSGETWYYCDLAHGLKSSLASITGALDINGYRVEWETSQIRDTNTLRVWLAFDPAYAVTFKVQA